jgi:hypothetical protein
MITATPSDAVIARLLRNTFIEIDSFSTNLPAPPWIAGALDDVR